MKTQKKLYTYDTASIFGACNDAGAVQRRMNELRQKGG